MDEIVFQLDQFEGPMDALLAIIHQNRYRITDIPIAEVCDQYLDYVAQAQEMDLDLASEFIVMASELLLIKSIILLPRSEGEVQSKKEELQNALQIYEQAKLAALDMQKLYDDYSGRYAKETDEIPPEKGFPLGLDPNLLAKAMQTVLNRLRVSETRSSEKLITPLVNQKAVSVKHKIARIVEILTERESASLFTLVCEAEDRMELIASFLGVLELVKMRRILILPTYTEEEEPLYGQEHESELIFRLNPDYTPDENTESEFDHEQDETEESDGN